MSFKPEDGATPVTIKITEQASVGLAGSIVKWQKVVRAIQDDVEYDESGRLDCPLCQLYHPNTVGDINLGCSGCPIQMDTGKSFCEETPYEDWDSWNGEGTAQAMLDYLVTLEAKCEVAPAIDQHPLDGKMVKVGNKYNWKNQFERLVYLGKKGAWHQFAKVNDFGDVWCEVLDEDLHMLEKTDPEEGKDEAFRSTCPRCYSELVAQPGGGVKCSNPECSYWFCF